MGSSPSAPLSVHYVTAHKTDLHVVPETGKGDLFQDILGLGVRWVRPCSGEGVPCPRPPQPHSACQSWYTGGSPSVTYPSPQEAERREIPPGKMARMGQGFEQPDHKANTLSLNSTFILEFYITATQELVSMCLGFFISFLSFFFSPFLNSLLMEHSIKWL